MPSSAPGANRTWVSDSSSSGSVRFSIFSPWSSRARMSSYIDCADGSRFTSATLPGPNVAAIPSIRARLRYPPSRYGCSVAGQRGLDTGRRPEEVAVAIADTWVDPICPWAWITTRWLLEAERVRDLTVRFHVMSLSILNEHRPGLSDAYRDQLHQGWGPVRVAMATELSYGGAALRALYDQLGELIHIKRAPIDRNLYAQALSLAGLPHT